MNEEKILQDINLKSKYELMTDLSDYFTQLQKEIQNSAEKHSFFLDKAIITISSGAIGIFLTFYKDISEKVPMYFMSVSLICFALAITFVLLSFYFIQKSITIQSNKLHEFYNSKYLEAQNIDINKPIEEQIEILEKIKAPFNTANIWSKITIWCNTAASIAIFLGILFGVIFLIL